MKAAKIEVESYWTTLFASALEKANLDELILSLGSAPSVSGPVSGGPVSGSSDAPAEETAPAEEPEEEDGDMGMSLFGDDDY